MESESRIQTDNTDALSDELLNTIEDSLDVPKDEAVDGLRQARKEIASEVLLEYLREQPWIKELDLALDIAERSMKKDMPDLQTKSARPSARNDMTTDMFADEQKRGTPSDAADEQEETTQEADTSNLEGSLQEEEEDETNPAKESGTEKSEDADTQEESNADTTPYDPYPDEKTKSAPTDNTTQQKGGGPLNNKGASSDEKKGQPSPSTTATPSKNNRSDIETKKALASERKIDREIQKGDAEFEKQKKEVEKVEKDIKLAQKTRWFTIVHTLALTKDLGELILSLFTGTLSEAIDWALEILFIVLLYGYLYRRGKIIKKVAKRSRLPGFMTAVAEMIPWISYLPINLALTVGIQVFSYKSLIKEKLKLRRKKKELDKKWKKWKKERDRKIRQKQQAQKTRQIEQQRSNQQ